MLQAEGVSGPDKGGASQSENAIGMCARLVDGVIGLYIYTRRIISGLATDRNFPLPRLACPICFLAINEW